MSSELAKTLSSSSDGSVGKLIEKYKKSGSGKDGSRGAEEEVEELIRKYKMSRGETPTATSFPGASALVGGATGPAAAAPPVVRHPEPGRTRPPMSG